ncbi:MAG: hypothetical protein A2032_01690 [Chloroflexi bacterium RBG_19FT_COMBO_49_13]|nr:MAG: hypothetical protein A2032_01690 [Chloroflexi bacterium RBG_19FT_COMBO_49_13]
MRSKSIFFYKVCLLFLSIGMALMGVGVLIVQAKGWEQSVASPGEGKSPNAPGTITGTVTYTGTITGTHMVWVGAFTSTQGVPPAFSVMRDGPGPYSLADVAEGIYYIMAGMDADDSGGPPDPSIDPIGLYPNNPVTVTDSTLITGVDIALYDPTPPPTDTGSILGWISYTGQISPTHHIIVFVTRWGDQAPTYFSVIPGAGSYTITNVAAYTYTVGAFMDLDDDMGPPQPDEPFGWYDPLGDGAPDLVVVDEGVQVMGIDIILADPLHYIYMPRVSRADAP